MTLQQIITKIEELTGTKSSANSNYPLSSKIVDINNTLDRFNIIAIRASGRWQSADDTNHTDYPITYYDVSSGRQDYIFNTDEQGNEILNIYKVRIKKQDGSWLTLKQRDFQTQKEEIDLITTGDVTHYDLTSNGIFLTAIPNYNMADGLEVWYSRTNSYFTETDLNKEPGIPSIFHPYLCYYPAYMYAIQNQLPTLAQYRMIIEGNNGRSGQEGDIADFYSMRNAGERTRIKPSVEDTR